MKENGMTKSNRFLSIPMHIILYPLALLRQEGFDGKYIESDKGSKRKK